MIAMADVKSGDIVTPGDQLCVIEELSPSFGTYEEKGIVYAATSGGVTIDHPSYRERPCTGGGRPHRTAAGSSRPCVLTA